MESSILLIYFLSLSILFAFGLHGLVMIYYYHKTSKFVHSVPPIVNDFPLVTIQLPVFNEVYVERVGQPVPVRCAVEVSALAIDGMKVEVTAIAAVL